MKAHRDVQKPHPDRHDSVGHCPVERKVTENFLLGHMPGLQVWSLEGDTQGEATD